MNSVRPDRPELRLDWCSHKAARYAVEHWHYSRRMPVGKCAKVGVWEGGRYIGCVLFSRGASPYLGSAYRLSITEVCELTRVALDRHITPVSRILAIAIRMLRDNSPGLRLIVSFADPNEGHHGGCYQAHGWVYAGMTQRKMDYIGPDGRRYRDRQVTSSGIARQFGRVTSVFASSQCVPIDLAPKHRYLYPLDPAMRAQILPLAKPYPKRASEPTGVGAGDQPEKGGSIPTRTLSGEGAHA